MPKTFSPLALSTLQLVIAAHSNTKLSQEDGMVYQVWEDGEVTLQKSGSLLWQRNLHCIRMGLGQSAPLDLFPHQYNGHAYLFTDEAGIEAVPAALVTFFMGE